MVKGTGSLGLFGVVKQFKGGYDNYSACVKKRVLLVEK